MKFHGSLGRHFVKLQTNKDSIIKFLVFSQNKPRSTPSCASLHSCDFQNWEWPPDKFNPRYYGRVGVTHANSQIEALVINWITPSSQTKAKEAVVDTTPPVAILSKHGSRLKGSNPAFGDSRVATFMHVLFLAETGPTGHFNGILQVSAWIGWLL